MPYAEILVYLTQDAIPCGHDAVLKLLEALMIRRLARHTVGSFLGKTLDPIKRHARLFNYPNVSEVRTFAQRARLGVRTAFFSNNFATYRRTAFDDVRGFPREAIVSEEVSITARMLLVDWKIAYQANATIIHSHFFTIREEFARYFDIGVHRGACIFQEQCLFG